MPTTNWARSNHSNKSASLAPEADAYFHTDAVQSAGKLPIDVNKLHVDLLSISAHKIYGPKGVGALYVRTGTPLRQFLYGGHHQRGARPGTGKCCRHRGPRQSRGTREKKSLHEDAARIAAVFEMTSSAACSSAFPIPA